MKKLLILALAIVGVLSSALAQKSKHLDKTISGTEIVNEYTSLTVDVSAGDDLISVASSTLNSNGRFASGLETGDLLFIIQVQGASINNANRKNFSWGEILDYNSCGLHEFAEVSAVPSGTSIELSCPLKNDYSASGRVVVVRVPRFATLDIPVGAELTGDAWNGSVGGFVIVEVEGNATIDGTVDMSEKGFRGTVSRADLGSVPGAFGEYASANPAVAGLKGEGIAGYHSDYALLSGEYGQGAAANAGGGGCSVDAGGGGGANAGDVTAYTGKGVPDIVSNPNFPLAWENEEVGLSTAVSSGGGKGGYTKSSSSGNPYTDALISEANWGSGGRRSDAVGFGGRPLEYGTGRLFLGGGGGQGHGANQIQGAGGAGGGMIYLKTNSDVLGSGSVVSNGQEGELVTYTWFNPNPDGAGGAGAGGTIVVEAEGSVSALNVSAVGGKGGDVENYSFGDVTLSGPGGGGGGGYVRTSSVGPTINVGGGANGIITGTFLDGLFEPNGATAGGVGESDVTPVLLPSLVANDVTVCLGETANLSVDTTNILGASILWYDAPSGGVLVNSGVSFSIPGITADSTLYVKVCPGETMVEVTATVNSPASVSMASDTASTCSGVSASLEVSGGDTYLWYPDADLDVNNAANVNITTTVSQMIYVDVSFGGSCPVTDSVYVEVTPDLNVDLGPDVTICYGGSAELSATGGVNYSWSPSTDISSLTDPSVTVDPLSTTKYFVNVDDGAGCVGMDSVTVIVLPQLEVGDLPDLELCKNDDTTLVASHIGGSGGAITYIWDDGDYIGPARNFLSSISGTMELKVVDDVYGCADSTTFNYIIEDVTVDFTYSADTCLGDITTLTASSADVSSDYDWTINGSVFYSGDEIIRAFTVIGANEVKLVVTTALGCKDSIIKEIEVVSGPLNTAIVSIDTICPGDTVFYANVYSGTPGYVPSWDFGDGTTSDDHSGFHVYEFSGDYAVNYEVVGPAGCVANKVDSVFVEENPIASFGLPERVNVGETILGENTSVNAQLYTWELEDSLISVDEDLNFVASLPGEICFDLNVVSKLGCGDDYSACTTIEGEALSLPNTFTPNNDGFNDAYELINSEGKTFSLKVYNRWGVIVFAKDDYKNDWNGIDEEGNDLASGTYYVVATDKTFEEQKVINGFFNLIR